MATQSPLNNSLFPGFTPVMGAEEEISVPWFGAIQPAIPKEQAIGSTQFPASDQVVVEPEGVFVPGAIFGRGGSNLDYEIQSGVHGREVVVFARGQQNVGAPQRDSLELEERWLHSHRCTHGGQWVALAGDRLLASGTSAAEAYDLARSAGVTVPFIAYVDPDEPLPFAGW